MSEVLVYLHGFLSSPLSEKSQLLKKLAEQRGMLFCSPNMNEPPMRALANVKALISRHKNDTVYLVGSSLGGFYVTALLAEYAFRAVLINPAVAPWRVVQHYLGEQKVYGTNEIVTVKAEYAAELMALSARPLIAPEKILVALATGDEVLDWTEGKAFYRDCAQWILPGEDHRLSNILKYADRMLDFLAEVD